MICFSELSPRRRSPPEASAFLLPAFRGGAFWTMIGLWAWLLVTNVAEAAPSPIKTDFRADDVLTTLPLNLPDATSLSQTEIPTAALADRIQSLIENARATGDPRFLGYADRLFDTVPDKNLGDRLLVLRATLAQSLHRFDAARADLNTVLARSNDRNQRIQAALTLANLELVQGQYSESREQCQQLLRLYPGVIAESCLALVDARTGNADDAYRRLSALTARGNLNAIEQSWAQGTLGDIAAQLGMASATEHWQEVLKINPDDLYIRAQLADWRLEQNDHAAVLTLTEGYEQVDALAVLRAIAMKHSDRAGFETLAATLKERFDEAQWRGTLLHKRAFARFQLDVVQRPDVALDYALENWVSQREPLDTRLLLRAARANGADSETRRISEWLSRNAQHDARYPENH